MKIYLILEYKKEGNNLFADPVAFTSKSERNYAFADLQANKPGVNADVVDIEITKRPYHKGEKEVASGG